MLRGPPAPANRTASKAPKPKQPPPPPTRFDRLMILPVASNVGLLLKPLHWVWFQALYISNRSWTNRTSLFPSGIFLKSERSQLFIPGPRNGRTTESIPVLPLTAGRKQEVLMNVPSVRSPGERFGLQVRIGRGDKPSEPVISRFSVVAPTPCTLYLPVSLTAVACDTTWGAPEVRAVMPESCQSFKIILKTGLPRAVPLRATVGTL